jgi:hypothetical protein
MRLVFVHGMKNEGQNPATLQQRWYDALKAGWAAANIAPPTGYSVDMPYYGDVLHRLTDGAGQGPGVKRRGPDDIKEPGAFEAEYYRLLKRKLEISDDDVKQQLPTGVKERGPANWEWVQAIARVVQKRSRVISEFALSAVPQVDGYLSNPAVQSAVDEIVEPSLNQGRTVYVAHSLGTIVSYRLLKKLSGRLDAPLFFTLGSPLGISIVVDAVAPIIAPKVLSKWINAADERDYVALVSKLDKPDYSIPIVNINTIHNPGKDAHSIVEYLKHKEICEPIAVALRP